MTQVAIYKDGGIYREVGPRGGLKNNYATVRDNEKLPPTTQSGNTWVLEKEHQTVSVLNLL